MAVGDGSRRWRPKAEGLGLVRAQSALHPPVVDLAPTLVAGGRAFRLGHEVEIVDVCEDQRVWEFGLELLHSRL